MNTPDMNIPDKDIQEALEASSTPPGPANTPMTEGEVAVSPAWLAYLPYTMPASLAPGMWVIWGIRTAVWFIYNSIQITVEESIKHPWIALCTLLATVGSWFLCEYFAATIVIGYMAWAIHTD